MDAPLRFLKSEGYLSMPQDALFYAWGELQRAAEERGLSFTPVAQPVSCATAQRLVASFNVTLHSDALRYFEIINGMRFEASEGEALLGGQFHAPPINELAREYRCTWVSPSDRLGGLDCVFPLFVSWFGEFLGFDSCGADTSLYEISLSNPNPLLAFSNLVNALRVFAAYFLETPRSHDFEVFQRVHERIDPKAAAIYWH